MFFTPTPLPLIDVCVYTNQMLALYYLISIKGVHEEFQKCEKLRFKGERSVSK